MAKNKKEQIEEIETEEKTLEQLRIQRQMQANKYNSLISEPEKNKEEIKYQLKQIADLKVKITAIKETISKERQELAQLTD